MMILECQLNSDRDRLRLRTDDAGWIELSAWRLYGTGRFCVPQISVVGIPAGGALAEVAFDDGHTVVLRAQELSPRGRPRW
jgi:hypothetical protein